MDYSIFKECILEALAERFGESYRVEYKEVLKNNGVRLDGISVKSNASGIAPTVYVNDFYEEFVSGRDLNEIADCIEEIIRKNEIDTKIDTEKFIDFEKVKDRIVFKLINLEKNKDLLETVPHKKFLDLAVVYYIAIDDDLFEGASILVNNKHLEIWGKNRDELDKLAFINSPRILKPELKSMAETLMEMIKQENIELKEDEKIPECGMYILSNERKTFGASVILYENIVKEFSDKMKSDVYIIPSSVHEVIMIPSKLVDCVTKLDEMICEVNATEVPLTDILSNHAYLYSRAKECITF